MESSQKFKFHVVEEVPLIRDLPKIPSAAELGGVSLYHIYIYTNTNTGEVVQYIWDGKRFQQFTGTAGPQGKQGIRGEKGDPLRFEDLTDAQKEELRGLPGPQGKDGKKGERGETGVKGDRGMQGEQGLPGEKGEKGDPGKDGKDGEKGERGLRGWKGDRGMQGNSGYYGDIDDLELINNITQGGATAALSAEMGKFLYDRLVVLSEEDFQNRVKNGLIDNDKFYFTYEGITAEVKPDVKIEISEDEITMIITGGLTSYDEETETLTIAGSLDETGEILIPDLYDPNSGSIDPNQTPSTDISGDQGISIDDEVMSGVFENNDEVTEILGEYDEENETLIVKI